MLPLLWLWLCVILVCPRPPVDAAVAAGHRPPEDKVLVGKEQSFGAGAGASSSSSDAQTQGLDDSAAKLKVVRWNRIVGNDTENIPFALIAAWAAVYTISLKPTKFRAHVHCALIVLFAFLRFLHTAIYASGLQPWRTVIYFMGFFCTAGIIINALVLASNYETY